MQVEGRSGAQSQVVPVKSASLGPRSAVTHHDVNNQAALLRADSISPISIGEWYRPVPFTTWHLQLQGEVRYGVPAQVYDIDLFDVSADMIATLQDRGVRVICYFSAGSYEPYRTDAALFLPEDLGKTLVGWPQEKWLDIRSARVMEIMKNRLRLAQQKGCDGVDPDNVDGFENDTGFPLTGEDQLLFNRRLANMAHQLGLAVGLKNNVSQLEALVDYFDFAVNEECEVYNECERLRVFTDRYKAVFHVEYAPVLRADAKARERLCSKARTLDLSTLVLPLALDGSFRLSCL